MAKVTFPTKEEILRKSEKRADDLLQETCNQYRRRILNEIQSQSPFVGVFITVKTLSTLQRDALGLVVDGLRKANFTVKVYYKGNMFVDLTIS